MLLSINKGYLFLPRYSSRCVGFPIIFKCDGRDELEFELSTKTLWMSYPVALVKLKLRLSAMAALLDTIITTVNNAIFNLFILASTEQLDKTIRMVLYAHSTRVNVSFNDDVIMTK